MFFFSCFHLSVQISSDMILARVSQWNLGLTQIPWVDRRSCGACCYSYIYHDVTIRPCMSNQTRYTIARTSLLGTIRTICCYWRNQTPTKVTFVVACPISLDLPQVTQLRLWLHPVSMSDQLQLFPSLLLTIIHYVRAWYSYENLQSADQEYVSSYKYRYTPLIISVFFGYLWQLNQH